VRAVSGDHPRGAHHRFLAGIAMPQRRGDSGFVLGERDDVGGEPQVGAERFGAFPQKRFEQALRDEHPLARTDVANSFVQIGDEVGQFAAVERVHGHDGAVLDELLARLLANDLFDANAPQNFHRPLRDLRRTRVDRGSPVMLRYDGADTLVGQQQRRRHADQAAADDQNVTFVIHDS